MDEILVNNFMVFRRRRRRASTTTSSIGDEAWDVDYFLHENPELKRSPFAWMTDFVGWLPMPDGGDAEAALTADYNAEMIEQRARFRRVRDRSIFVGDPDDIVDASFGPGLPRIRDWTEENFDFAGYVTGFEPTTAERDGVARRSSGTARTSGCASSPSAGRASGGRCCGGSSTRSRWSGQGRRPPLRGRHRARGSTPSRCPTEPGVEVRGFLPDLVDHLAACDVAVVQGGLDHHGAHRQPAPVRLRAAAAPLRAELPRAAPPRGVRRGTCLDYDVASDPDALAAAILTELDRVVDYKPVETDGASRAAALIAALL